jgi:ribosomal-protein-alanine N-acetyltransferase
VDSPELRTDRLLMRRWREEDLAPFAALNADPVVMEHFPSRVDRAQSDAFVVDRIEATFRERGYGLWAVEVVASGDFIGFVGLNPTNFDAHFTPAVEVGWRLAAAYWGRGYATEAARRAVAYGLEDVGLAEIVSFTATTNVRSERVMQRIGMRRDPAEDFDHPLLPAGDRLRRHLLYRIP